MSQSSGLSTSSLSTQLGTLKRLDPRTVWVREAYHFTPWLAEHLSELGEVLGLDLELVERESPVGPFSADLLARDLGRDRIVVIENQIEATDHTHLGQIITYAAGLDAGVVVWLSREFREEHRQALDWLNRTRGTSVDFFGVAIEVLQIDDSKPAVNLKLVAFPNDWSRETKTSTEVSEKRLAYQTFFQLLIDDLREKHHFTNARAGQPQNWYTFSSGVRGYVYSFSFAMGGRLRAEVYIDSGDADQNLHAFETLMLPAT